MSQYWDDELYHHGTKGMQWGRRLYQNPDGSLTPLGRLRYGKQKAQQLNSLAKAREAKRTKAAAKASAEEQAKKEAEEKEKYESEKQKALKSGTAADVLKYQGDLTGQQLNDALNRIRNEKALKDIAAADIKTGWDKATDIANKADKMADYVTKGTKLYNAVAKVTNSVTENKLPIIGEKAEKATVVTQKTKDLMSKSASEILKTYKGDLTNQELSDAIGRLSKEMTLAKMAEQESKLAGRVDFDAITIDEARAEELAKKVKKKS